MIAIPPKPVAPTRARRWLRRLFLVMLIIVGLPAGYYYYSAWSLNSDIARVIAETDALDPRWRFEDIQADRKSYRDDENSALLTIKIVGLIGKKPSRLPTSHKHYEAVFENLSSSAQLNLQQFAMIREAFEQIPDALIEARKLKDVPNGRFAHAPTADGLSFLLVVQNHHDVRLIYDLLRHDAMFRAQQGDPDAALESCMALLNAARSLGDDPFIVAMHIRLVGDAMLAEAVERTLAQGYPSAAPLKELQGRLRRERDDLPGCWIASVRGERAMYHQLLDAIHQRKIQLGQHMQNSLQMRIGLQERLADYFPALYTKDYAEHLRHFNELVMATRLPLEKQLDRFTALEQRGNWSTGRNTGIAQVLPLWPPDLRTSCNVHLWGQAILAATEAGLACERFRIDHKRWPESLTELVKTGILEAIPADPYNGQPLRFVRLKEGLAIYSVGRDKQNNGGKIQRGRVDETNANPGFQLWDPAHRRQPPRPPAALDP